MLKIKSVLVMLTGAVVLASGVVARAAEEKNVTLHGKLVDMACYTTMNMSGAAHGRKCGEKCLTSGLPAGIVVNFMPLTLLTNPVPLANYVGKTIKVVGKYDAADHVIYPSAIWWEMGKMWMTVKLHDNLHK